MIVKLNQKYELFFFFCIGIGINIGYVMVGNIGSGDYFDYMAIGDMVNVVFWLELVIKQVYFDLVMSEKIFSYLQDLF